MRVEERLKLAALEGRLKRQMRVAIQFSDATSPRGFLEARNPVRFLEDRAMAIHRLRLEWDAMGAGAKEPKSPVIFRGDR